MFKSTYVVVDDERELRETRRHFSVSKPSFYLPKSIGSRVLIPAFEDSLRFIGGSPCERKPTLVVVTQPCMLHHEMVRINHRNDLSSVQYPATSSQSQARKNTQNTLRAQLQFYLAMFYWSSLQSLATQPHSFISNYLPETMQRFSFYFRKDSMGISYEPTWKTT